MDSRVLSMDERSLRALSFDCQGESPGLSGSCRLRERNQPDNRKANQTLVDWLMAFAARKHATPAQVALAWVLSRRPWIAPIPGTTKLSRLDENVSATSIALTSDDLREIDDAAARIQVHGDRYPEHLARLVGR
jgi:aryl-alcohol dehydrogenase-like predicted oxidoreductase